MMINEQELRSVISSCKAINFGLIPALKKAQELCELDEDNVRVIADELGLSVQQVESIMSFYTRFSGEKAEACAECTVYDPRTTGETRVILRKFENLDAYMEKGGYSVFTDMLCCPSGILDVVSCCGVVGRGGSGFPVSVKWKMVRDSIADRKYVVMNGAEGEPGTGKDRALLMANPYGVIEGMSICAIAVGARNGIIYIRDGYDDAKAVVEDALAQVYARGLLGTDIKGSGLDFDIEVVSGAGCYVCGEETGLIESIESNRGEPRSKPPYPGVEGLWGCPTVINNAETFASVLAALEMGSDNYKELGTEKCPGTKLFTVSGCARNCGVYEFPFGVTARQIFEAAGGCPEGKKLKGIQVGGNGSGTIVGLDKLDVPLDIPTCIAEKMTLGTGAIRFIGEDESIVNICKESYEFFSEESCSKCVPCRLGNAEILNFLSGKTGQISQKELEYTLNYMALNSACGLGQASPTPLLSALQNFREEFNGLLKA